MKYKCTVKCWHCMKTLGVITDLDRRSIPSSKTVDVKDCGVVGHTETLLEWEPIHQPDKVTQK